MTLKQRLTADGSVFTSETDAEVIAHLIAAHYGDDLPTPCARHMPSSRATTRSWR